MTAAHERYDLVLLGGGLANGLIAAAALHTRPSLRIAVVEQRDSLCSAKTWCFHDSDVAHVPQAWSWLRPFVTHQWPGYEVKFESYQRHFDSPYSCIAGEHFGQVLARCLNVPDVKVLLNTTAVLNDNTVTLSDGRVLEGDVVLDGRGATASLHGCGFQKFVGWEVEVDVNVNGSLPICPVLMDASVEQNDGYRFVYVLPLGQSRLLVEDTYFSSNADLDDQALEKRLDSYLDSKGWRCRRVVRSERGVLAMPWSAQKTSVGSSNSHAFEVGYRGGWFQPATGYSVPMAVSVAAAVSSAMHTALTSSQPAATLVAEALQTLRATFDARDGFYRLLNRLAFLGVADADRRRVFERFYKLPSDLVARFYAGQSTWWDKARILGGRPPVPLSRFRFGRLKEELV